VLFSASDKINREKPAKTVPILQEIRRYVENVRAEENEAIGTTQAFSDIRADLTQGRKRLGNALADTLVDWANTRLKDVPIVGVYNSSSYRGNVGIPAGKLTRGQARAIYPYPNDSRVYRATGKQIEILITSVRKYGESINMFTPQLSSNLRLNNLNKIELKNEHGVWEAIDPRKQYGLVMDAWLSENGFKLPELDWVTDPSRIVASELHQDVMIRFAPRRLSEPHAFLPAEESSIERACEQRIRSALVNMTTQ
jgi:2',3'-cyclic-nucleotide 2'-phosphodiesterase (5'-nucleotidase family)